MPKAQPGFLTDAQLASLRGTVTRTLPWFATVLKNTPTRDAEDDLQDDWSTPIAIYNCDIEFVTDGREMPVGGQMVAVGSYLITLPWNAVVEPDQRLSINNRVYEINNRFDNWTDQAAVYVDAEEVEE